MPGYLTKGNEVFYLAPVHALHYLAHATQGQWDTLQCRHPLC